MVKIIIVAHGYFSSGILSSLELIAGKQEQVENIDFVAGMSSDDVKVALEKSLEGVKQAIILTDLLGGTPFKVSATASVEHMDKKITVLSGLNLAMLLEAVLSRDIFEDLDQLTEKVITSSQKGIVDFASCLAKDEEESNFDGGI